MTRLILAAGLASMSFVSLSSADCAAETEPTRTNVFISGEGGYHTYRIPALVVSKQGTLLAFCEGRKTGRGDHGDLDLRRSTDGGKTWQPMQLVYEEGGDAKITIGNPCPVVDQDTGVLWLPFTRDNNDVFVTASSDDGKSWSKPIKITASVKKETWGWYATGPGNAIQLRCGPHKGRLLVPCDHRVGPEKKSSDEMFSHVIYSDDHGKTWKLGGVVGPKMNECAVVELADGSLMLNMRSYRGKGQRAVSISKDGGMTWSPPMDDAALIEPVCQASFIRFREPTSAGKGSLLFSNPASTKERKLLTVRLSDDEGKSWPVSRLLHEGPAAYSCLAVLPDGSIGCLYENGEKHPYERITFARFNEAWLRGR